VDDSVTDESSNKTIYIQSITNFLFCIQY